MRFSLWGATSAPKTVEWANATPNEDIGKYQKADVLDKSPQTMCEGHELCKLTCDPHWEFQRAEPVRSTSE